MDNISQLNLNEMTPVQAHTIPLLLTDPPVTEEHSNVGSYDLMAAAQTGSGKTLAYLLPIMQRLMYTNPGDAMTALVSYIMLFLFRSDRTKSTYFCLLQNS